jgi:DNA-binding CsgD family transcriptional regulator
MRGDPLRIVEAAYTWLPREADWLDHLIEAAKPYSTGGGVLACTVTCTRGAKLGTITSGGGADSSTQDAVESFCRAVPSTVARSLFAPTEFAGNAAWRLERLAKERKVPVEKLTGGAHLPSMWAVIAGDPRQQAILLGFPARASVDPSAPFPHDESRALGLVGAHLGAAMRLRAIAPVSAEDAANDPMTEAVMTPDGRVLHASGEARSQKMRESLSEALLRSERARTRLCRVDAGEALDLWTALVEGRWSVVETTERDGKRFLLARKNSLASPDLLALTKDESDVVWLTVQGHSTKYIAYELGLSETMVTRRLARAMRKLRVDSRRDLLRTLGTPEH